MSFGIALVSVFALMFIVLIHTFYQMAKDNNKHTEPFVYKAYKGKSRRVK